MRCIHVAAIYLDCQRCDHRNRQSELEEYAIWLHQQVRIGGWAKRCAEDADLVQTLVGTLLLANAHGLECVSLGAEQIMRVAGGRRVEAMARLVTRLHGGEQLVVISAWSTMHTHVKHVLSELCVHSHDSFRFAM